MTTATSLQPGTLLQQREIHLSILKDLTIMDDIFMRNVLKDSACTEYILKVIMDQDNLKLEDQILQATTKIFKDVLPYLIAQPQIIPAENITLNFRMQTAVPL